ncbi:helix-turn-helix domain-containing protein [Metabacillus schmidteae]|uniref:helix-turn-helix domain-containing protein n=1 Tax=Metabacillus schmidteae TaxID=2730405 RepID=UPI001C37735A|nr:helix-turn-helix domain-containing protein [Metabacillus schmidteae]
MLTTKEISQILSVSEETVRRWIRNQELKANQEGKSYYVDSNDLIEFVKEKAKAGTTTSIGKMASFLPIAGLIAGGATASLSKIISMINAKEKTTQTKIQPMHKNFEKQSIEQVEECINALNRQKKKLELEYQMNLLEVEEEIEKYQKIKQNLKTE